MAYFIIHQCTNPDCNLRLPINPEFHSGKYCPRCGASMIKIGEPYQNPDCQTIEQTHPWSLEAILDNIRSVNNVGSIFRTAEGVGVSHLYLCGLTPNPEANPAIHKTALGAEKTVAWSVHPNALELSQDLIEEGILLIGVECTPNSRILFNCLVEKSIRSVVLVFGNEKAGIDPDLIKLCNQVVKIPMNGEKTSLNVAVAFGIATYWLRFGHLREDSLLDDQEIMSD